MTGAWTGWRWLTRLSQLSGPCFEGPRGSSIPESVCSHPWLLVGHAQQETNLVHPQSGPAFCSCFSGAKWLLPPEIRIPACKENILLGCHWLLFTTLAGRSKSASLALPASPWAQYPTAGEALGIAQLSQCCGGICGGTGCWGQAAAWQHQLQQEEMLPTSPESFLLPGELLLPAAFQPQGGSWVIFLPFLMLSWQCAPARPALASLQVECGDLLWVSLGRTWDTGYGSHQLM